MATWGDTGTGDTDISMTDHCRMSVGQFTAGAGFQLDSMSVRCGTNAIAGSRWAIYTKATGGDPNGATLVEDLGTTALSADAWTTVLSVTNPTLIDDNYYYLAIKGTNASGQIRGDQTPTGDLTGQYDPGTESHDETDAWDATAGSDATVLAWSLCMYITYSAADSTAPTLSSPAAVANGNTACTGSVSTDEGNGTLYWSVTTSSTGPSAAQVQAGQDHNGAAAPASGSQAVSGTGVQNISDNGLTAGTTYYIHYQHKDAATNNSTVSTSASFTTTGGTSDSGLRTGVGFVTFALKRIVRRYAG